MEEDIKILIEENSTWKKEKAIKNLRNLLTRYKETQLTDKEKEVVEAYRNLVKITGKTGGWVVCDPKQMWSDYFVPKSKIKEKIEELKRQYKDYSSKWEKSGRDKAHPFYRYLVRIEAEIDILQELLERRRKDDIL